MLFRIRQYLSFLFKSSNQHGVHSPFVYNLVTLCFYNKKRKTTYPALKKLSKKSNLTYKVGKLLNRIPEYFGCKNALVLANKNDIVSILLSEGNSIPVDQTIQSGKTYDIIFLAIDQLESLLLNDSLFNLIHNDSTIVINLRAAAKKDISIWKKVKNHAKVTVIIDTFHLGFVFIRKEQAKEHFTIRL